MKPKNYIFQFSAIITCIFLVFQIGCNLEEIEPENNVPTVTLDSVIDRRGSPDTIVIFHGNIIDKGSSNDTERGFCWNSTGNPNLNDEHVVVGSGTGKFNATIYGLIPGENYYINAYATNSAGTSYGTQKLIETLLIIYSVPALPLSDENVTIFFDSKGSDLEGNNGIIYTHTGLVVNSSWNYVIGSWGDNGVQPALSLVGNNLYKLEVNPSIREYYNAPAGDVIEKMAFVFRNDSADLQTIDLFIDVDP